jgi:hypothetical protein
MHKRLFGSFQAQYAVGILTPKERMHGCLASKRKGNGSFHTILLPQSCHSWIYRVVASWRLGLVCLAGSAAVYGQNNNVVDFVRRPTRTFGISLTHTAPTIGIPTVTIWKVKRVFLLLLLPLSLTAASGIRTGTHVGPVAATTRINDRGTTRRHTIGWIGMNTAVSTLFANPCRQTGASVDNQGAFLRWLTND